MEFIEGKPTDTFGYNGDYLGPVIRVKTGDNVSIKVKNEIDEATTVHWHGLEVDGDQDGGPHSGIQPGTTWNPQFKIEQNAATLWYHPHLLHETGEVKDITGADFSEIKTYLSLDLPIWVIINTTYKKLPATYFEEWITPSGPVSITYKEHSVLITGYDDKYIYFNDPITGIKNRKEPYSSFKEAWEQMGKQAIVIFPDP